MADAPVHLHPAGLHCSPLGGQVYGGLTGLSFPALAHGASEALPFARLFQDRELQAVRDDGLGWRDEGRRALELDTWAPGYKVSNTCWFV